MRAVTRPRAMRALMAFRACASSISSSRGRFTEISDWRRFDRAQFGSDFETVPRALAASITRHGFHGPQDEEISRDML